ncbi:unnamed protein product [Linum tenue]|uniref:NADH kinase n=1 Tax=Linum tenue TaxID=586396 RepID=A0AAV0MQL3_9ROSI|nr:unnamed protein product [Linum tenue]
MAKRRLLLLLKPFDMYPVGQHFCQSRITNPKIFQFLDNRRKVHKEAVNFCQSILQRKAVDWEPVLRANLSQPIHNFDFVVTVGGDGTLLKASHFMDDSIPVLGVNSDPTKVEEVEEFGDDFDATRSTGYLCAATMNNFEQVLDDILDGRKQPSELLRMSIRGTMKPDEAMEMTWSSEKGFLYIDGSNVVHSIQYGDTIQTSVAAPHLKVFLPDRLESS